MLSSQHVPMRFEDLSVLVISSHEYCQRLKLGLTGMSNKLYKGEVKVKLAESVDNILSSPEPDTHIDYIVIVVDTTQANSTLTCKQNLIRIGPSFVASRICIVNGSCYSGPLPAAKELCSLADCYMIPYINGEVMENTSCKQLAEKILRFAAIATGLKHGVPMLIPTPKDFRLCK